MPKNETAKKLIIAYRIPAAARAANAQRCTFNW
jgi:hypothetical protein